MCNEIVHSNTTHAKYMHTLSWKITSEDPSENRLERHLRVPDSESAVRFYKVPQKFLRKKFLSRLVQGMFLPPKLVMQVQFLQTNVVIAHAHTHTHEWFLQTNVVVSTSAIDCLQRLICLQNDLLSVECDVKPCSVCRSLKFSPPFYCMTVFKFSIEMIF